MIFGTAGFTLSMEADRKVHSMVKNTPKKMAAAGQAFRHTHARMRVMKMVVRIMSQMTARPASSPPSGPPIRFPDQAKRKTR